MNGLFFFYLKEYIFLMNQLINKKLQLIFPKTFIEQFTNSNLIIYIYKKYLKQSMSTLLFTNFHTKPQPLTQLMNMIINHPLFEQKVIEFRQLFNSLQLKPEHLIHLGTLYYTFVLPQFSQQQHKRLATELYESLQVEHDNNSSKTTTLTYMNLAQYLGKICLSSLQNIDIRNTLGFLSLLIDRITDRYIINTTANLKTPLHYHFKLELYDTQTIIHDSEMPQQFHRQMAKDVYFEEKVFYDQEEMNVTKMKEGSDVVLVRELKYDLRTVVPLGYICEDFISQLINNQFETKNSYRLKQCKRVNLDKIQYWLSPNQTVTSYIRDQVVNQQIFHLTSILSPSHLPQNPTPNSKLTYTISRINHTFSRQAYYQKLKDIKQDKIKYFNILSEFFDRDQFNIDQITLTREKLIARRKEHLLGIQSRETIKKDVEKDFEDEARNLPEKIHQNMIAFWDQKRMETVIKELAQTLKAKLQQGKNINSLIQPNLSQSSSLPSDNPNPFTQDIITYTQKQPLQLLVIGRPKSGKSTLAKAIAKKFNLVYISVQSVINKLFERVKFFEENPPQTDQDGNVVGGLTAIEKCIIQDLNAGKSIDEEDILDLINNQFQKEFTQGRGYILDLPFQYKKYWIDAVISSKIQLPKINCRFFTHIVQVEQTDQEWKYFSEGIMQKPQDLSVTSYLDRYLLAKPKPLPVQGEEQQPPAEEQQKPQPLKEQNLLSIKWKQGLFSLIQHLTQHIHPRRYLKVENSYQSVEECIQLLQSKLYVIPLPKKIQGNEKELLTVDHAETKLVRKWSPWGIVDPVQLKKDKLINGKFQFAAQYAGRVFVFENQINLNLFLNSPRKFLDKLPQLPKKTNICITGPRKSGKKTLAKKLSEIYKLQVINFEEILQRIILKQKSLESHVPSNPEKRSSTVHLSESQFKDFSKGNLLNAKDILPIVLYQLGIALQKKPAGWGVEKQQGTQNQEQQQKKAAPVKKKKKQKGQQDERPKTPPVQDLSLKQIIPEINHFGKLNQIRGYILINFPNNEQQLNSLKQFNIPIDKMIILNDNNEQSPNKILAQRLSDAQLEQVALFFTAIGPVKQSLGEEVCKQISIDKTPQQILNKVRQIIDPFYLKTDDDTINRVLADKQQEDDPVPMGFCGEYCPVALKQKWLIKGKQQFQLGVQAKRYRLCGEKEMAMFKENPQLYLNKQNTHVPPRILFMGLRGVGLTTQLLKLTEKYKIPIINLKETLFQHLEGEKNKRKTERYYKRGFKKPQYDEEGKLLEDQELNAESPQFDKRANQIEVTKKIFEGIDQILINGNFFDVDQEKISTNIVELLTEARRLPEVVYVLKSEQNKWLARNLDPKQIEAQLQKEIEKIRAEKQQEIERQRKAAQQAGEQFTPPAQQEQNLPKLQDRIAEKTQSLKARRQADASALESFIQAFRALNIQVIEVNCQRQIKHVTDKINYTLKNYIEDRTSRWEKYNMLAIERHRVSDFLNNFIVKESRFGKLNPISLIKDIRPCPLIYNDRIYYLKDSEQRQLVIKNPSLLQTNRPIPQDINTTVRVFIIGKAKTGKTTLSRTLAEKLGLIYLTFTDIISSFVEEHKNVEILHILNDLKQGKTLSDEQIVSLILKRIQHHDCQKNGWVLDGLPQNKNQAQLLNRKGIIPTQVFSLNLTDIEVKKKVLKTNSKEYEFDIEVIHERLEKNKKPLAEVELYYESKYNNLKILDASLSKWGIFETARKIIQKRAKAQRQFIRSLTLFDAAQVSHVGINFNCVLNNMSEYQNYCPISYKLKRQYIRKCLRTHENLVLYNKKLYIFNSQKELHDFLENPETFIVKGPSFQPPTQVETQDFKFLSEKSENKGYCMVELLRKKLVKGNFSYGLIYKNKYFLTSNPKNMKLFIRNPTLYQMVKLPDKLPVEFEKKNELKKIAKRNDCTAFLQHHLSNIMMRSLAQLGYRRPKYPTLSSKQSALKFLSISLKATNPNKDDEYRQKYTQQLQKFIKECSLSEEIRSEVGRKNKLGQLWQVADEQNLIKLCEEYSQFMKALEQEDKVKYFSKFIR